MNEVIRELDKIDVSLYLIYSDTKRIMDEINADYDDICDQISAKEFELYIRERYWI